MVPNPYSLSSKRSLQLKGRAERCLAGELCVCQSVGMRCWPLRTRVTSSKHAAQVVNEHSLCLGSAQHLVADQAAMPKMAARIW